VTFRQRLTLTSAVAVSAAIGLSASVIYVSISDRLTDQVDTALKGFVEVVDRGPPGPEVTPVIEVAPQILGGPQGYAQFISADGLVTTPEGQAISPSAGGEPGALPTLPVSSEARSIARRGEGDLFEDIETGGTHVRVLTHALAPGMAIQIARSMEEVDEIVSWLRLVLITVGIGGIAAATLLGALVTRASVKPIGELDRAAEHVIDTGDLAYRVPVAGRDELSKLAMRFNQMLDALETSVLSQRRLVADASHELRTPITSIRTNFEVLAGEDALSPSERAELVTTIGSQIQDLASLVDGLVELARESDITSEPEEVRLDLLTQEAIERVRRFSPQADIRLEATETSIIGQPERLERALMNLLDNAVKYAGSQGPIEVSVEESAITVRDHGPGIPRSDLDKVLQRFYRGTDARSVPGSGLGLAIVDEVVRAHGGSVTIDLPPDGGTSFRVNLPSGAAPNS
jgi:two-component system, OmpR family, sensor histidine kinase MprB